jgi:hypothetical protein
LPTNRNQVWKRRAQSMHTGRFTVRDVPGSFRAEFPKQINRMSGFLR